MVRSFCFVLALSAVTLACANADTHRQRGVNYVEKKQYPEAIVEFRSALEIDPQRGDIRLQLADAHLANQDAMNGLREYVRAADQLPRDAAVQIKTGNMLLAARLFEDARGRAEKVLARHPANVDALVLKGNALAQLRQFDAAAAAYNAAMAADPQRFEPHLALGALASSKGDQGAAEAALIKATQLDPRSVRPKLALASFYAGRGDRARAETALVDALKLDPQNVLANRAMGSFYMATGRASAAEQHFAALAKASPTPANMLSLAQYYVDVNRSTDARRVLTDLATRDDSFAEATVRLASLDVAAGDRSAASNRIKQLLARQPRNIPALLFDAQLLSAQHQYEAALAQVSKARDADPNSAAAHEAAGLIYQATDRRDAARTAFERAIRVDGNAFSAVMQLARLELANAPEKAGAHAQHALGLRPGNIEALALLARSHLKRGESRFARPMVAQILARAPTSAVAHNLEAELFVAANDPERARRSYMRALEISPADRDALQGLADLDVRAGRAADAVVRIETALGKGGRSEELLLLAAEAYSRASRPGDAERALRDILALNPGRTRMHGLLGQMYIDLNRLDDAVKEYEAILAQDPRSVSAYTTLGALHERRGDAAAAEKAYQGALAIDSGAGMAANNLAYLWTTQGRNLDQALELAQSARRRFPDDPQLADTLGWVYVKKGLPSLALPHLDQAVGKMNAEPVVHYHLGVAYLGVGDGVKAKESLEKALSMKRDFAEAADARKTLQALALKRQ